MGIDLYALDAIRNYKKAIAALEGYADKIIDDFLESPEGQTYIQANPDEEDYVGEWFLTVLTLTYKTEVVTLPHITPGILEPVLTQTLPQTLSREEAADAGSLIPELMAFWSYLHRVYRLSTAPDIIRCLKTIQPIFNALVVGNAQSMQTRSPKSPNSQQQNSSNNQLGDKHLSSLVQSLDALGDFDVDEDELEDLDDIELDDLDDDVLDDMDGDEFGEENGDAPHYSFHANQSQGVDLNLDRGMTRPISSVKTVTNLERHKIKPLTNNAKPASPSAGSVSSPGTRSMNQDQRPNLPAHLDVAQTDPSLAGISLSQAAIATLTQQTITNTTPGTIVQDFQLLLDAIGDQNIPVSGKSQYIPIKLVATLNAQLSHPIRLDLKRPLQKSYANVHGLCLLLRASGLGHIGQQGKKDVLRLHPQMLALWNSFNPTEKYFSLLEAWMLHAMPEMIGELGLRINQSEGSNYLLAWSTTIPDQTQQGRSVDQARLTGLPKLYNLALMELFGLIHLEDAEPKPGKGWQLQAVWKSALGLAVTEAIQKACSQYPAWESAQGPELLIGDDNLSLPLSELRSLFQPYFPEWQQYLPNTPSLQG